MERKSIRHMTLQCFILRGLFTGRRSLGMFLASQSRALYTLPRKIKQKKPSERRAEKVACAALYPPRRGSSSIDLSFLGGLNYWRTPVSCLHRKIIFNDLLHSHLGRLSLEAGCRKVLCARSRKRTRGIQGNVRCC